MRQVMPYVVATGLALTPYNTISAADPLQVKTIIDHVRANGTVHELHGSNIRTTTINSKQIGYEGNYDIAFTVPDDEKLLSLGIEYLDVSLTDSSIQQQIGLIDGTAVLPLPGSVDGILDGFERVRLEVDLPGDSAFFAKARGSDAQVLGQKLYDRVVDLYHKFIKK